MIVRTRFAPSPTGKLHLGHVMAAWVAHEFARRNSGTFLLRHEDIDATRVRDEFYQEIETDLQWLGLIWDEPPLRQSNRSAEYDQALGKLRSAGFVFPCFCTRREINEIAAPHGPEGPIYPGTCRHLPESIRSEKIAAGNSYAWRLDAARTSEIAGDLTFQDLVHGTTQVNPFLLGDVVLARKDIGIAYHLAVVVDDAFQKITHVTRGEDLFSSTHVHRLLQKILGFPEPVYLHHPLVLDENGKRLAKRHDALAISTMRSNGATAGEIIARIQEPSLIRLTALSITDSSD